MITRYYQIGPCVKLGTCVSERGWSLNRAPEVCLSYCRICWAVAFKDFSFFFVHLWPTHTPFSAQYTRATCSGMNLASESNVFILLLPTYNWPTPVQNSLTHFRHIRVELSIWNVDKVDQTKWHLTKIVFFLRPDVTKLNFFVVWKHKKTSVSE